jgi:DNA polymerase-3 subunit gamma/tau
MEKKNVAASVLRAVARLSEGSVRDAEGVLEQLFALGEKEITEDHASLVLPRSSIPAVLDFLEPLFKGDAKSAIDLLNHFVFDGFDLDQLARDLVEVLRKMMLLKIKTGFQTAITFDIDEALENKMRELSASVSMARLIFLIELFMRKEQELKRSIIPQLPLELAVVEICKDELDLKDSEEKGGESKERVKSRTEAKNKANPAKTETKSEDDPKTGEKEIKAAPPGILDEIKAKWVNIIEEIQKENSSLPLVLRVSEPCKIEKNVLKIGVGYTFHKDRINDLKNCLLLSKIIEKYVSIPLQVEGILVEQKKAADDNLLEDVLKNFGGKVVE